MATKQELEAGYKEQKEFICVSCGRPEMATKFASQKTFKCKQCKESNMPIDPTIVSGLDTKSQREKRASAGGSDTKDLPCIHCGTMVTVTKFASAAKVECNACKGIEDDGDVGMPIRPKIDLSKINRDVMPSIEEYNTIPSLIANAKLRDIMCPACGHEHMKILRILDWSEFGLVITYQCTKCMLMVQASEQCHHLMKTMKDSVIYDYSGNEVEDLIGPVRSSRLYMTVERLLRLCEQNGIPVDGIELPRYRYKEDRPVPVGFAIDPTDRNIGIVQDVLNMLSGINGTVHVIQKLKELFVV